MAIPSDPGSERAAEHGEALGLDDDGHGGVHRRGAGGRGQLVAGEQHREDDRRLLQNIYIGEGVRGGKGGRKDDGVVCVSSCLYHQAV